MTQPQHITNQPATAFELNYFLFLDHHEVFETAPHEYVSQPIDYLNKQLKTNDAWHLIATQIQRPQLGLLPQPNHERRECFPVRL